MPAYETTASFQVRLVINDIKLIALVHRDISGNLLQVFVQSFWAEINRGNERFESFVRTRPTKECAFSHLDAQRH